MIDPAIEWANRFNRLIDEFKRFKDRVVYVRDDDGVAWKAKLLALTEHDLNPQFKIRVIGKSQDDTVDSSNVYLNEIRHFEEFKNRLKLCLDEFKVKWMNMYGTDRGLVFFAHLGTWVDRPITGIQLSNDFKWIIAGRPVLPDNFRTVGERCRECGDGIPPYYMRKHLEPAVHHGHLLTKAYLHFLEHFRGEEVTVNVTELIQRQATLKAIHQHPTDQKFQYWYILENGDEDLADSCDIDFDYVVCDHCKKKLRPQQVDPHLEACYHEGVLHWCTKKPLVSFEETFVTPIFEAYNIERGRSPFGIAYDENRSKWVIATPLNLMLSEYGCALYQVRITNRTAWIPATHFSWGYNICDSCGIVEPTYALPHDHFHADDSGILDPEFDPFDLPL